MNNRKKISTNQRDIILIVALFVIVGGIFLYFQVIRTPKASNYAHIYYGRTNEPLATIDFLQKKIIVNKTQDIPSSYGEDYPLIDEGKKTITLLGDYEINGRRQIVVIEYDFGSKSVQIIEEQSPNHLCSKEGISYGKPLICLPNRIRVEFESGQSDSDFTV